MCASGTPPYLRDLGPRPPPVSRLEGVENFFLIAIFSVTAADSAAVFLALGAAVGSLTSAPEDRGPLPQIWGRGSPNQNFTFSTLIFFAVREINHTHIDCRHFGPP